MSANETLICVGDAVKSLGGGRIGGYLVRFGSEKDRDLDGDFFTAKTYFGARDGDGVDLFFHHGRPIKNGLEALADHIFQPIKTKKDDVGLWAEAVLDLSDEYERMVHELVLAGKLGWSSGTASHLVKRTKNSEIERWPIVEGSLTPTPAEPRNRASVVKSLDSVLDDEARDIKAALEAAETPRDLEKVLRDAGFSRKTSELFVSKGIALGRAKASSQGDPDGLAAKDRLIAEKDARIAEILSDLIVAKAAIPTSLK